MSADDSRSLLQLLPTDLPPYPTPFDLPETPYRLEELIGSGGFGAVYRASVSSEQHLFRAIKFCLDRSLFPALERERDNLERLMKAGGKTWSPRLVRLYGYNLEHRTPYLVYEFVAGGDLVRWLAKREAKLGRGLNPSEVLALITQVAEALAFAHKHGLVHRDLKPANVLMTGEKTIKLADFGIGGLVARQAVQSSKIGTMESSRLGAAEQASLFRGAGTPLYMSREQKEGAAPDPRHDIYSLGVMWYQLLVGDVTREMAHGWERELEAKFAVPVGHVSLIEKCVGWIEERPKDAGVLLTLLRGLQEPVVVDPPSPPPEPDSLPVPPSSESQRSRQFLFVTWLRQLLDRHDMVARSVGAFSVIIQGILLGLALGYVLFVITAESQGVPHRFDDYYLSKPRPRQLGESHTEYLVSVQKYREQAWIQEWKRAEQIGMLVGFLSGFALLILFIWLRLRSKWKTRVRAEQSLAAKIDQMLTAFPQECQTWGGRAALADAETVKAILRELEPPQLGSHVEEPVFGREEMEAPPAPLQPTLGQQLGTVNIVLIALFAAAAAWLLISFIKF